MLKVLLLASAIMIPASAGAKDANLDALLELYAAADEACRGSYVREEVDAGCAERTVHNDALFAIGMCFGKDWQPAPDARWHKCEADSCGVGANCN